MIGPVLESRREESVSRFRALTIQDDQLIIGSVIQLRQFAGLFHFCPLTRLPSCCCHRGQCFGRHSSKYMRRFASRQFTDWLIVLFFLFFSIRLVALITPLQDEQSGLLCPGCERNSQSSSHLWPSHTAAASCCLSSRLIVVFRLSIFTLKKKKTHKNSSKSCALCCGISGGCKNLFQSTFHSFLLQPPGSAGHRIPSEASGKQTSLFPSLRPSVPPSFPRLTSAFLPTPQIPGPLQTPYRPECDFSVSSRLFEFPGGQRGLGSPSPAPPDLQPNTPAAQLPAPLHSAPPNL